MNDRLKKQKLLEYIEYLNKFNDDVKIEIPTVSGLTPYIINKSEKYATLRYDSEMGFNIGTSGTWINSEQAKEYSEKLLRLSKIADTLNKLYVPL